MGAFLEQALSLNLQVFGVITQEACRPRLGAELRAFPASAQAAVRVTKGLIVMPGSVIKPSVGDVLVIGNPQVARGVLARFETYWAKTIPVEVR